MSRARFIEARNRMLITSVGIVFLGLVFAAFLARGLALTGIRPVMELIAAARRIALGDLGVEVTATAKSELKDLQLGFNQMSAALRRYRNEMQQQVDAESKGVHPALRVLQAVHIVVVLAFHVLQQLGAIQRCGGIVPGAVEVRHQPHAFQHHRVETAYADVVANQFRVSLFAAQGFLRLIPAGAISLGLAGTAPGLSASPARPVPRP